MGVFLGQEAIFTYQRFSLVPATETQIEQTGRPGSQRLLGMVTGGHYAELYNTYFRHQSPDYNPATEQSPVLKEPMMTPG
jgi:hypothetical protein